MDFSPVLREVAGIKILQVVQTTKYVFILRPFLSEQEVEHIRSEVDSYVTGSVQSHLQTFVYASRRDTVQNVTNTWPWIIIVPIRSTIIIILAMM